MGSLVSTPACHSSFPPIPHTGKGAEMMIGGYHWPSGPVREYKRLSDVLKISENMTRLPEPEERCTSGKEPSSLPPASPPRAPSVFHLCVALQRATLLETRFVSLSTDGVHSPLLRSPTVQCGAKPEAWALRHQALRIAERAPLLPARSLPTASLSPRWALHLPQSPAIRRAERSCQAVGLFSQSLRAPECRPAYYLPNVSLPGRSLLPSFCHLLLAGVALWRTAPKTPQPAYYSPDPAPTPSQTLDTLPPHSPCHPSLAALRHTLGSWG